MRYHVATNRPIDFEALCRDAEAGKSPRQTLAMLADRLGATFQQPDGGAASAVDRLRCRLVGTPECWAMARRLAAQLDEQDVIFCSSEGIGFPIAAASRRRGRPRLAIYIHNVDRPRTRAALKLFRLGSKVDLFLTNSRAQTDFLRSSLRVPESRLLLFDDQTDVQFFTPGPPTPGKRRPVVASVGLEQRDYRTLAEATRDLDVDVRISGFSSDAAVQARAFPDDLPANMERRFYEWPELVQLYRDADVIAVSLFPCRYAAGITTVMEAMACRRPLVVTRTEGLANIVSPDFARLAQPGDADGLRRAIVDLLADRDAAEAQADRGYELGHHRHDSDRFVATIVDRLATL